MVLKSFRHNASKCYRGDIRLVQITISVIGNSKDKEYAKPIEKPKQVSLNLFRQLIVR